MLNAFLKNIEQTDWDLAAQKTLIALSGGMDSVAMAYLFKAAGVPFALAHCNFQLRNKDSDQDANFCAALAKQLGVDFYSIAFDTSDYANRNKVSIQVAARDLRYDWLEKIRLEQQCSFIATAHHLNDSLETLIFNLTKGCGIRGLHGIPTRNGNIIRPLLFASKKDIADYIATNKIPYREDASNASDKYHRNLIRNQVIPLLESINPNFINTGRETIQRFIETEQLYDQALEQIIPSLIREDGDTISIDAKKLAAQKSAATILYELLKIYKFNNIQTTQIIAATNQSGKRFFSPTHRLVVDRSEYILEKLNDDTLIEMLINEGDSILHLPTDRQLSITKLNATPSTFPNDAMQAFLDADKLKFPLTLRRWKAGDQFQPLGMNGQHQSLQDFFTHQKMSIPEKEKTWILESSGVVCWIVGRRIDERFKITDKTKSVIRLKLK